MEVQCFCSPHDGVKSRPSGWGMKLPPAGGRPPPSCDDGFLRGAAVLLTASYADSQRRVSALRCSSCRGPARSCDSLLVSPRDRERDRWTAVSVPPARRSTLRQNLCFPPLVRRLFYAVAAAQVRARIRVTFWGDVTTDSIVNTDEFTVAALSKARAHRLTRCQGMFWNK